MIISIDFDGTICRDQYPLIGCSVPYAIEVINKLKIAGHIIIINTCREGKLLTNAINWLLFSGIPFDRVNDNLQTAIDEYGSNARKIFADVYIDDRNFGGFPGWLTIEKNLIKEN